MHPTRQQYGIILRMPINVHVRDVPEAVHATLTARAERAGMSLRQYVIEVLRDHAALPALDDWLDGLAALPPVELGAPAAEAVHAAREEDDAEVLRERRGP
jgi:plasmid stability protein